MAEERFAYRWPIWLVLTGLLLASFLWITGAPKAAVLLVLHWLVIAALATFAVVALVTRLMPGEVVLTEHHLAGPGRRRKARPIEFTSVESLVLRESRSGFGSTGARLEIRAPGRGTVLFSNAFADRATFDRMVETIAARVAAHGGPRLIRKRPSRADGAFVA